MDSRCAGFVVLHPPVVEILRQDVVPRRDRVGGAGGIARVLMSAAVPGTLPSSTEGRGSGWGGMEAEELLREQVRVEGGAGGPSASAPGSK